MEYILKNLSDIIKLLFKNFENILHDYVIFKVCKIIVRLFQVDVMFNNIDLF